ncbi:flagellar basal body rod protein FlgC [Motiliproteus coralliicola]|uniref:Flagellar basal-body rod protein FlgC n=1 Tax=Motiliproteus coralliicola TaxID=2283196 RepID=A0A369WL88_9GAMM|nr:flagellar basal body rod protein FlgC [Motiliproteus coralliicola]RDE22387.1 flagellar basal body rod protein FlgC [Motiliproteus coralliicola]
MSLSNIFNIAGSGMSAQSIRLNTVASNIANAESVSSSVDSTYRARHPVFEQVQQQVMAGMSAQSEMQVSAGGGVKVNGIIESDAPLRKQYEPNHPMADEEGFVFYPNVNVVEEMANMISASRSFQTNADLMGTAKDMMQRVLQLGQ